MTLKRKPKEISPEEIVRTVTEIREAGDVPFVRTVANRLGVEPMVAHRALKYARRAGVVSWVEGKQGTIAVVPRVVPVVWVRVATPETLDMMTRTMVR